MTKQLTLLLLLAVSTWAYGNNIRVLDVSLTGQNTTANTSIIQFDLAWDNSWRISSGPANYDAAWVFAKYRVGGGQWTHAILNGTGNVPGDATVDVTTDRIGAFVYRSADGSGQVNFEDIELIWSYGNSVDDNAVVDIQVFAIEMVYVPEGAFRLGTGGFGGNQEENEFRTGGFSSPYLVSSENAITIANSSGNLYYDADNFSAGDQAGTLSANYPKGFGAFYCMKYEISEGQWLAFFNSLTDTQKANNDVTDSNGKNSDEVVSRNTIAWTSGTATSTAPDRAMSYLSPANLNAYFDWTGLRPMTELEYEKAARGPTNPTDGEFAWGTSSIHAADYFLFGSGSSNERISNPGVNTGNATYQDTEGTIDGPLRVGIFAASVSSGSREETGGSYYGIMELSGNLYERCITVGNARGRSFTGLHGNGIISSTGSGTVANYPDANTGEGYSYRGGSWLNGPDFLRVSDRFDGASIIANGNNRLGGRGVRTAE